MSLNVSHKGTRAKMLNRKSGKNNNTAIQRKYIEPNTEITNRRINERKIKVIFVI